jgi:hypothetical protein
VFLTAAQKRGWTGKDRKGSDSSLMEVLGKVTVDVSHDRDSNQEPVLPLERMNGFLSDAITFKLRPS